MTKVFTLARLNTLVEMLLASSSLLVLHNLQQSASPFFLPLTIIWAWIFLSNAKKLAIKFVCTKRVNAVLTRILRWLSGTGPDSLTAADIVKQNDDYLEEAQSNIGLTASTLDELVVFLRRTVRLESDRLKGSHGTGQEIFHTLQDSLNTFYVAIKVSEKVCDIEAARSSMSSNLTAIGTGVSCKSGDELKSKAYFARLARAVDTLYAPFIELKYVETDDSQTEDWKGNNDDEEEE